MRIKSISVKATYTTLIKGYECVNLEDFNVSFENEAGKFTCTAILKDGKIELTMKKTYKSHFLPKDKWMEMVQFLQIAQETFGKKLLLSKK